MNKRQKEVLQARLDNEKEVLKALEKNYTKALADIKKNIRELQAMPGTQSKAYQIEFQKQLESQISAYLDVLKGNNYKTITEYMNKCYEEGFAGSVYCLQGFGEGITIPIDQEAVIKAVKLTGDDLKLSEKLEGNTKLLKQNVLAEMQRGFATELSYADIARNISNWGNADMNRSKTIARTEGHRVQCKADIDCAYKARELGCDTVKQWNSTLDGKTRPSHQRVDKEWRELDEPFSNGLMYPGDPSGRAAEVVNCRCSVDDVPRWYVEKGGGQYRRNNITGEIIKCRDYTEFKEKYLQIIQNGVNITAGGISGALNPYSEAASKHAAKYYEEIRKRTSDIDAITKHTEFSKEQITEVKQYLFIEEQVLDDGKRRFDPSYDIAQTWQRLTEGNYEPHDILLIKHELFEKQLISNGKSQSDAHILATKKYNYTKGVAEYNAKIKKYSNRK